MKIEKATTKKTEYSKKYEDVATKPRKPKQRIIKPTVFVKQNISRLKKHVLVRFEPSTFAI